MVAVVKKIISNILEDSGGYRDTFVMVGKMGKMLSFKKYKKYKGWFVGEDEFKYHESWLDFKMEFKKGDVLCDPMGGVYLVRAKDKKYSLIAIMEIKPAVGCIIRENKYLSECFIKIGSI